MKYIDLHCDTIMALMQNENSSLIDCNLQINLEKLKNGKNILQCFAMFVYLKGNDNPFDTCIKMIDRYYKEIEANKDSIAPVFKYSDFEDNQKKGLISSLLTIEEGAVTMGKLEYLRTLYRLGVRMICLNWNFINGIGHPNFVLKDNEKPDFKNPNVDFGLTEYGFSMIKQMNELGIIIDVSHLSDKGFYDVIDTTTKPIVASHSNARSVCNNVRNLTDDMILKLKNNGGVMGINFCADFMNDDGVIGKNTIDCAIKHMKYIKELAGIEVLAIGTDFDGINPDIEINGAHLLPKLFSRMAIEGFSAEDIEAVAYKNFLRVLKANLE